MQTTAISPSISNTPRAPVNREEGKGRIRVRRGHLPARSAPIPIAAPAAPGSIAVADLSRAMDSWIVSCQVRQMTEKTIHCRRWLCDKFLWFLANGRPDSAAPCDRSSVEGFLIYAGKVLPTGVGRWGNTDALYTTRAATRPVSVASYHRILRAFCNWMVEEGFLSESPMAKIRGIVARADQIQPLSQDQVQSLLVAAKKSPYPKRNEALLLIMLDTGLRAQEVCNLRIGDVDRDARKIVTIGKGNKRRAVYYGPRTARALAAWEKVNPTEGVEEHLFMSERGTAAGDALTVSGLDQMVRKLAAAAGISGIRVSPHSLRHTFAVTFLRSGGHAFTLRELLGHTTLTTTQRYVNLAQADIAEQARVHSPVDHMLKTQKKAGG